MGEYITNICKWKNISGASVLLGLIALMAVLPTTATGREKPNIEFLLADQWRASAAAGLIGQVTIEKNK